MPNYFMSQKQMREARFIEAVINAIKKRNGDKRATTLHQCGCGCGVFSRTIDALPAPKVTPKIDPKTNNKKDAKTYLEWLEARSKTDSPV